MMEVLKQLQVDWKDRRLISDLYMNQKAVVRIGDGESEPAVIGRACDKVARCRHCCFPYMRKQ